MEFTEYEEKLKELEKKFNTDKYQLAKNFAFANNPHKIGDIIENRGVKIKITKIEVTTAFSRKPSCMYSGIKLKKDNTPMKSGDTDRIYQINL